MRRRKPAPPLALASYHHLFPITVKLRHPTMRAIDPLFAILFPSAVTLARLRRQLTSTGEATHSTQLPISDGGPEVDVGIKHIGGGHLIVAIRYPSNQFDDDTAQTALLNRIRDAFHAEPLPSDVTALGQGPLLEGWADVESVPLAR